MKTAIIYRTKHGTTDTVSRTMAQKLSADEVTLINLKKYPKPDLRDFGRIIVGGSIHAGAIQKQVKNFCKERLDDLQQKEVGLFICCMDRELQEKEFEDAFPEELKTHAKATGIMGGEFVFERMNFLERFIVKKISKPDHSVSEIDEEAIDAFVSRLQG
ncbi:flavodoxin domain-containing protein [Prolixibacter sp. NT017]|uniref:flavodoxin domain-containing protein n=1 Tax=Prolixibacter sp. NT017 TaxID=2652390 RepID=UPI00126E97BB|nr:flavodoxin domain-containing protein [Prolixibacter sp. NT017]GET25777.1 flavodoxin [Prolixibacter sp. NT017]